ncbi:ABC transporter permease [Paramicrobacterium agarici]|uniref:ABC transporter permease n=1 Tax=Paramicrobacterium agarici TaxID=630514 RepID=UPI0011532E7D|nr:ABC transporter permease [Microbacterium agarici]TQO22578.1 ABC-type transport system involved in multi-copper enzyme maturation permease subunit [Microbacterium agarici]
MTFFRGLGLIIGLELRQRVRGVAWYVLIGIFVVLVAIVTALLWLTTRMWGDGSGNSGAGGWLYSLIVYFVLLLGTLATPAFSGNAVNGERDAGTLATTQVTLVSTTQIVLGKFVAAWVASLAFLVASLPFIAIALVLGNLDVATIAVSFVVLAAELGVLAALGVALSAIITRPLFSIVVSYLVVAALSIGTLIAFGLLGTVTTSTVTETYIGIEADEFDEQTGEPIDPVCLDPETRTYQQPRYDLYWGFLAANPYVVIADAAPGGFDSHGNPTNMFSTLSSGVRSLQTPPEFEPVLDYCNDGNPGMSYLADRPTPEEVHDNAVPSWFVGLGIHVLLAAGALWWAIARTRTPAKRLATGSRIA